MSGIKKYTVLTYNFDGYEIMREIPKGLMRDDAEYIYVTNDHTLKSETWNIVYEDSFTGDGFDKVCQLRRNIFKYVNTDVVLRIDGSIMLNGDITPLMNLFIDGNYDIGLLICPVRCTMEQEYAAWEYWRNLPHEQSEKAMQHMTETGYDVKNYKGLYGYNLMIQLKNRVNEQFNEMQYDLDLQLGENGHYHRVDQTVGSYVLNMYFRDKMKVMSISHDIMDKYPLFNIYAHNSNRMIINREPRIPAYLFDEKITPIVHVNDIDILNR
jgi:hypothetical protein